MHFQVRTDNHIANSEALTAGIQAEVEGALGDRYGDRIRRIEVYLQDMNAHKAGVDKRCAIEATLPGLPAVAVDDTAESIDEAVSGAIAKLTRALDKTFGRIQDRGDRVSMSGEET